MDDGTVPRPPRRIPAGTLTQLQPPPRCSPPPRRPWVFGRILAGFLVLLVVVAAGASAGWLVRAQSLRIDTAQVLNLAGPAVVRVLATTCEGTGEASGVLIDNGRVLTATSAVRQPLSIVVVAPDGRIRRANLLGTSADGVAVLQPIGRIDATPVRLAPASPDAKAEQALIGYTAAGQQTVRSIGSADDPRPLSTVMNAAKLGGPVVDKSGRLVGTVVGDTVQAATIVPLDHLRAYVAPSPEGITPSPGGDCERSRGPQHGVVPELQVAGTDLAVEVQKLLGDYLTLENKHDFDALRPLYSKRFARALTRERDRENHQTSYFFGARLTEVTRYDLEGLDGAYARMSFAVLFSPNAHGAQGQTCNRLDQRYRLVREGGRLVIDRTASMTAPRSCDTD